MRIRPIRKRHRVSSQNLYQSISILRRDALQEDLLERDRQHVDRRGTERARLFEDVFGMAARHQREHAAAALHARDTWRAERRVGSAALEDELNPAIALAQIVER